MKSRRKGKCFDFLPVMLRDMRLASGFEQAELGRLAGLSDKAISSYEVGRTVPHLVALERMCNACGKSLVTFFWEIETAEKIIGRSG